MGKPTYKNELVADLSQATAATINQLREAFQIQKLYERDARGGTRYNELVYSHFGVTLPDAQHRPEYLGGGTIDLNINPVTQTAPSLDDQTPQGNLAAFGTASTNQQDIGFNYSAKEHCVLLGFMSARADLTYQNGLNKMWTRNTKYDFYFPEFAHLGEQPIKLQELVYSATNATNDIIFGYQERFAEYKYRQSYVSGASVS